MVSCTADEWDKHYNSPAANKSELNLYEYIESRQELSTFAKMLKKVGYDSILNSSQTFTVWAPNDSALLGVDTTDLTLVKNIVTNHIARFSFPTSGISNKMILMMDNKLIPFTKNGSSYTFGEKPIIKVESDIATSNGIVHMLSEYVPYKQNLWEFIKEANGVDSLKNYINSLTILMLDNSKSYHNGVFVDSVMMSTNYVFDNLAALNKEDSIYTAILPDNSAWTEAYNRIKLYYNTLNADGGVFVQRLLTKQTLVQDLFFRGKKTLPIVEDSLKSTGGNSFADPSRLFANSQLNEMSNGYSYVTDILKYPATESWFKTIKVEAESTQFGRSVLNFAPSAVASIGSGLDISNGNYLTLRSTTQAASAMLYANFPIPYTLSAKYNIYCVFVPTTIVSPTDVRPNKVRFYLTYMNSAGNQVNYANIDENNNVLSTAIPKRSAIFTTDGTQITKMLVAKDFVFPYCNLIYSNNLDISSSLTVALKVENATGVTGAETANFNRDLRIDCIILEPVQ